MTTDVLALREALLEYVFGSGDWSDTHMRARLDALIAAVRAETLAGSGAVDVAAVQKAVGILRDYSHGEECAVYAEDDDLVDVYDDPTNEACDCGLRDLILTLTGALPDVGATALALAATPPTPARERGWARDCYCNAEYPGCTDPDCSCSHHALPTPVLTAARLAALEELVGELVVDYHQTGSIRDHVDPNAKGWEVNKDWRICEDVLCEAARQLLATPAPEVERVPLPEGHRWCDACSGQGVFRIETPPEPSTPEKAP